MSEQLVLPVQLSSSMHLEDLIGEQNKVGLAHLTQSLTSLPELFLFYWGKKGTGKTHLLIAACQQLSEQGKVGLYFDLADYQNLEPCIFDNLRQIQLLAIDNIEKIQGIVQWEQAFFDCFNKMRQHRIPILMTANTPPNQINYQLADLKSRLSWGVVYQLVELNEEEIRQVLLRIISQRGLNFPDLAIDYLLTHYQRNLIDLIAMIEALDLASLKEKKRITVAFIKTFFDK